MEAKIQSFIEGGRARWTDYAIYQAEKANSPLKGEEIVEALLDQMQSIHPDLLREFIEMRVGEDSTQLDLAVLHTIMVSVNRGEICDLSERIKASRPGGCGRAMSEGDLEKLNDWFSTMTGSDFRQLALDCMSGLHLNSVSTHSEADREGLERIVFEYQMLTDLLLTFHDIQKRNGGLRMAV